MGLPAHALPLPEEPLINDKEKGRKHVPAFLVRSTARTTGAQSRLLSSMPSQRVRLMSTGLGMKPVT